MDNRTQYHPLASFTPYFVLHAPSELALLQYYRVLSQNDQGIVRRVAEALAQCSAKERGEKL